MAYKHGIYTEAVATVGNLATRTVGTVPVYIGTAPINKTASVINKTKIPILIESYSDFVNKMGYSDEWDKYTLCEAAYAHFKNDVNSIAPFVVINVLDPATHAGTAGTATVTLTNKVGYISTNVDNIVITSIASTSLGDDFTAEYTSDGRIKITYTGATTLTTASVTYNTVDATAVEANDFTDGIAAVDLSAIKCGIVPNIMVMPKYSATYKTEMIAKCEERIDGKWGCVAYIDIPTDSATTIETAKTYKTNNNIDSKYARLHFPKVKHDGKVFHLSVLDAVTSQVVDASTDGVSCRSSSNKRIICDVPVLSASTDFVFSEKEANDLNENGITTVNYIGGAFRLWGGHMANYSYANVSNIEAKDRSDATVRMQIYLDNWLKSSHIDSIDAPLTRRDIDNIIAGVNIGLNSFANSGYLLKGECYFAEGSNTTSELADGDLVLEVLHTEVPNGKSISFRMAYDVRGLDSLYETEVG